VFGLFLTFLLMLVTLSVVLWAGTSWFQALIYNEATPTLIWSAPAAGAVLTLFFAFWSMLAYKSPGSFDALGLFTRYDEKQYPELSALVQGKTIHYKIRKFAQGAPEYRDTISNRPLPTHPDAIIVKEEDGQEVRFEPERDKDNKFLIRTGRSLIYKDDRGRSMSEDTIGQLAINRAGRFWGNIILNLLHLGVWFVCLWLLLRFQWPHALGLAVVFWAVLTVIIIHPLLAKVEDVARQRQPPPEVALACLSRSVSDARHCR
jgi:hypothetical protein